jgi:hypothetical protein
METGSATPSSCSVCSCGPEKVTAIRQSRDKFSCFLLLETVSKTNSIEPVVATPLFLFETCTLLDDEPPRAH